MNSLLRKSVSSASKRSIIPQRQTPLSTVTPCPNHLPFPFVGFMLSAATGFAVNYYIQKENLAECEAASTQSRIRGNYENKIRSFSGPEKIFETFASIKDENGFLEMSYLDILKCVTPYNFGEMKSKDEQKAYMEQHGKQISKIFKYADSDQNQTVSFPEFYFFIMLMQLSTFTVRQDFEKYGGNMTADEFSQTMRIRRKQTSFGQKLSENKLGVMDGRNVKATEQDFLQANTLITKQIFDGRETIDFKDYVALRNELMQCLWHYEFYQYNVFEPSDKSQACKMHMGSQNNISTEDFANSILIYLPQSDAKLVYSRMSDEQKSQLTGQISFDEYIAFQWFLEDIEFLKEFIDEIRVINKDHLKQYCKEFEKRNAFCNLHQGKAMITDQMVEIIFMCLDVDGNGFLEHDELLGMLHGRLKLGQGTKSNLQESGGSGLASIWNTIRIKTGL